MNDSADTIVTKGQVAYDAASAIVLGQQARRMLAMSSDYIIDSDSLMTAAGDDLRNIKTLQKQVEEQRTAITGPLNTAVKAVNDLFRPAKEWLEKAESQIKGAMHLRIEHVEKVAREEAARAAERERVERERIAAEQREQERLAREAQEAAAAAQREVDAAAARGDEQARLAAEQKASEAAAQAEEANQNAAAAAVQAEVISLPSAAPTPLKVVGVSSSKTLDYEVTDMLAIIKHVAVHPELVNLLVADSVKLRAYVRLVGEANKIPGLRVFEKRSMSARSK